MAAEGGIMANGVDRRREEIVELVQARGYVSIEDLAETFSVTPQTVRRDINALSEQALLRRYHGGAGLPSSVENIAYPARKVLCHEEKKRIAQLVAQQIPDHASLFLNIGTTTEEVARALQDRKGLRVITNNLNIALMLSRRNDFEVIVAGGIVRARDGGIIGASAVDLIHQFKVDYGVIGISGIDMDGTLLDFDYREVRVAQSIVENSRKVFLVADHTKFGRNAMIRLGALSMIDALFTDRAPPAPLAKAFAQADVAVHVADS
jgi:DeoR family glycerol-3-phosphate regulon repressor